jgi:hypothetical protein
MITALDTNILVSLWDRTEDLSLRAQEALEESQSRGRIVLCPIVYAELIAAPGRGQTFIDEFLDDTGIHLDWEMDETVWRAAGAAFASFAARRKRQQEGGPRRILADFIIGAHAEKSSDRLLTLDRSFYRLAFPNLNILTI